MSSYSASGSTYAASFERLRFTHPQAKLSSGVGFPSNTPWRGPSPLVRGQPTTRLAEASSPIVYGNLYASKLIPRTESNFQFISIRNPAEAKDRGKRRLARSHAVKQGLQNSRRLRQEPSRGNAGGSGQMLAPWSVFVSPSPFGPFETLFGDSPRLRALLSQGRLYNSGL